MGERYLERIIPVENRQLNTMSKKHSRLRNVSSSARAAIIDLLLLCEDGAFANNILPARLSRSNFNDQDKALITKVVYSTLRQQIKIDHALSKLSNRPLSKLDPVALCALRSIVSQIQQGFDVYAVVDETVKVIPFSLKGFVNAIARKASELNSENKLFVDETPAIQAGLPQWIYDEVSSVFPNRIPETLEALNASASVTLAPITGKELLVEGARRGEICPSSLLVRSAGDISKLDPIQSGKAVVADQGSQLVVEAVLAKATDTVLDVCSAPGGKSILLSRRTDKVFACDVSPDRLLKLEQTLDRVDVHNVFSFSADARKLPFSSETIFDKVLVDAPCSGLGVLRRRPDARHRITTEDIVDLVQLQKEILTSASKYVAVGGYLIYSVCTFSRAETIGIDEWIEDELKSFSAEQIPFDTDLVTKAGRGYQLCPTADNDSMFVLRLRRDL